MWRARRAGSVERWAKARRQPERAAPHLGLHLGLALALIVASIPAFAQGSAAQIFGAAAPTQADQCSGPLGSLLPDCQAKASSGDVSVPARSTGGGVSVPTIRSGSAGPAEAAPPPPEAPGAEAPTDFQRFVASSIGQVLPLFGASLFERVPSTFAPLDRIPVTADYVIGPGDQILLRAWGQVNLDLELTVDRAGAVFIPQAGNINVAGLQFQQLSGFLRAQLERVFRNFDLTVNMGQLRSIQIFVMGQARRPGTYTVSSLSTLINALFASGGPSSQGSMRHVQLKRGADVVTEFDLYDLLLNGDKSKDVRLLPGDVVYVPPSGPRAAIAGSVRTPAVYELKTENTVAGLLQMAGGLSAVADLQRATLERIHQSASREVLDVKLDAQGVATGIGDGDVLYVAAILPRFANAVTLRGNVANPGRFPWRAGMRLRDVIPDKDSLITRDYWKKHNVLGFVPARRKSALRPRHRSRPRARRHRHRRLRSRDQLDLRRNRAPERARPQDRAGPLQPRQAGPRRRRNPEPGAAPRRRGHHLLPGRYPRSHVAAEPQGPPGRRIPNRRRL